MTAVRYSAAVRELFAEPRHAGDAAAGVAAARAEQGVQVELSAAAADGQLQALRFRAWGCPHLIAAAEAFCRNYEGRPVDSLAEFAAADLMQSLAVPTEKTGRILVLEDTVRSLGKALREASATDTDH